MAEERILSASGDTLAALSELASLRGNERRADVEPYLTMLAAAEGWPSFFARREWQLRRLARTLDNLDTVPDDLELLGLAAHVRRRSPEEALTTLGLETQTPIEQPLLWAGDEHGDPDATGAWVVAELRAWIEAQWRLLSAASMLHDTSQHETLAVIAQAFEDAERNHALHTEQVRAERATYERQLTAQNAATARSEHAEWNFLRLLGRLTRRQG